jgi:hypothetical protein
MRHMHRSHDIEVQYCVTEHLKISCESPTVSEVYHKNRAGHGVPSNVLLTVTWHIHDMCRPNKTPHQGFLLLSTGIWFRALMSAEFCVGRGLVAYLLAELVLLLS